MENGQRVEWVEDYGMKFLGVKGKVIADVTAAEHVRVLLNATKHVDSSVSKTCNVTGDMPWADFKDIYMQAWKGGAKGCTTFNVDGKKAALFKSPKKEEEATMCSFDPETGIKSCE
jgi:ribonucleoside-diphosphate reductase alpha chain